MKNLSSAVLLFLAVAFWPAPAAVAQGRPPEPEAKENQTASRDRVEAVRRELEAQYAKLAAAVRNKDYDAFMALRTDDFSALPLTGQPQSTEQMAARTRLLLQVIQPPIEVSFEILDLNVKGDEAVATVRQRFSRMQRGVDGQPQLRKLETGVTQDETWVRTPGGWKLKFVGNERDLVRIINGEPVDPYKHYFPNAPSPGQGAAGQAGGPPPQPVSQAELEVRRLEREWLDAYERRDLEAMNRIVADDFIITFPNGETQTKAQVISSLKGAAAGPSPKFYTEDVRSRAYGDTVILTGRVVAEWERDGKKVKEQSRYTDTYVRRRGRWEVAASHLSHAEKP